MRDATMSSKLPLKVKVSITLDYDVVDKIRYLSDEEFRSFSQYVNLILRKHIAELEETGKKF